MLYYIKIPLQNLMLYKNVYFFLLLVCNSAGMAALYVGGWLGLVMSI